MNKTAVLIFAFCREKSLKSLLESIKSNDGFEKFSYYFFIDGPRSEQDKNKIAKVTKVIEDFSVPKKVIQKLKNNKGLASSIISGVEHVSKFFDKFIVLEDDLIIENNFFDFMENALATFEKNDNIINVSGFSNLPLPSNTAQNFYLLKRSTSWGWASWSKKWRKIDLNNYENVSLLDYINLFFVSPDLPFMLRNQKLGKINSWAIRLVLCQVQKNLFSITPILSFVSNQGDDEFATNVDYIYQRKKSSPKKITNFKKSYFPQFFLNTYKWLFELYLYLRRSVLRIMAK